MNRPLDYLGTRPCGCAIAWASGDLSPNDLAKDVGAMIRDGLDVERVTTEESRRRIGWCALHRPTKQEEMTP